MYIIQICIICKSILSPLNGREIIIRFTYRSVCKCIVCIRIVVVVYELMFKLYHVSKLSKSSIISIEYLGLSISNTSVMLKANCLRKFGLFNISLPSGDVLYTLF